MDVKRIRADFPILEKKYDGKKIVYLDNTATSLIPVQVVDACCEYFHGAKANIHRGVHKMSEEASRVFDNATKTTAKFINSKPEEMIFTRNTTESINTVMYSLFVDDYFKKGDEIVTTIMEHHSNFVPWQFLRDKVGIELKVVEINDDFTLNMEDLENKITDKTKMVAVAHASNTIGTINDVKEICKIAHEKNSYCLVDGAQSAPHIKLDVKKIDADFFAFSGHKMLAPSGIGGLYGKKEILEEMPPFLYGGGMIEDVTIEKSTWAKLPGKFEAGTPDIAGAYGMKAAVDYLERIGMADIRKHEKELTNHALERIQEIKGINVYTPKDSEKQVGIILFAVDGIDAHDVALSLDEAENIAVRSGFHCSHPLMSRLNHTGLARASFYLYNTKEEIDLFIDTLKIITDAFSK
ncbi:MAG: cysteine desulfurase [Candidatus Diapherotrites archaeon]